MLRSSRVPVPRHAGDEPPAALDALKRRGYKALRPGSLVEADADAEWYAPLSPLGDSAPEILLDTAKVGMYGGTGQPGNWEVAAQLARHYRVLLAGGLTPDNVAQAIIQAQPWGVDVASGVDRNAYVKSVFELLGIAEREVLFELLWLPEDTTEALAR